MTLSIRFTNVEDTFRELRQELGELVETEFDSRTLELTDNLRDATPVDSGHARDSWHLAVTQPDSVVGEVRTTIFNTASYIAQFEPDGVIVRRSNRRP